MKIHSNLATAYIQTELKPNSRGSMPRSTRADQVETSDQVQMLARNLPNLKQQLQPRAEIMERFAGIADDDDAFKLDAAKMDHTLEKLQTA